MKTKTFGSIENSHKEKIVDLSMLESRKKKIKNRIQHLLHEKQLETNANVFELLKYDDIVFELKQDLTNLENDTSVQYLLKVSDIFKRYNDESNEEFTKQDCSIKSEMNHFVHTKIGNQRGQLYKEYTDILKNKSTHLNLNGIIPNPKRHVNCPNCEHIMTMSVNETYVLCEQCGVHEHYFEPSVAGLTYEQEIHTETNIHFAYKRINHLRELLSQLQAKETSDIPEEVLDKVRAEFKKARIQHTSEIVQSRVKSYLKKLGLNKFYEHTRQITNILNGKPPPVISNTLYESFITMFTEIQEPFEKVCPKHRKNFFSYNYILFKFCELLGDNESKQFFPLLKSREKLYHQDCIWKDICTILGWYFIKSV
jgi:hypothetical protein